MRTNTQDTSQCVGKFQSLLTARKRRPKWSDSLIGKAVFGNFRCQFKSDSDHTDCDVGCVSNITKQYDGSEKTSKNSQMTEYRR